MEFEAIVNNFSKTLRRYIVFSTKNESIADDILQEVFIKLYENSDKLKSQEKLKSWLYAVTKNTIADYYRKNKKTEFLPDDISAQAEEPTCYDEIGKCVLQLMPSIPKGYSEIIRLYDYKELSAVEISQMLNMPLATVKSKVQRGRKKIKEALLECCEFELDKNGAPIYFASKDREAKKC